MWYQLKTDTYLEHELDVIAELREEQERWDFVIDGQGETNNPIEENVIQSIIDFSKKHPSVTFTIDQRTEDILDSIRTFVCNGLYYDEHIKVHFEPFKRVNLHI